MKAKKKKPEKKDAHVFLEILALTNISVQIGTIDLKQLQKMDKENDYYIKILLLITFFIILKIFKIIKFKFNSMEQI